MTIINSWNNPTFIQVDNQKEVEICVRLLLELNMSWISTRPKLIFEHIRKLFNVYKIQLTVVEINDNWTMFALRSSSTLVSPSKLVPFNLIQPVLKRLIRRNKHDINK